MKYKIKIDDFDFFLKDEDVAKLDSVAISDTDFQILKDSKNWNVHIEMQKGKHFRINVDGVSFDIDIEDESDLLVEKMGLSLGLSLKLSEIKAPMPGLILDVLIKEGQEIKEGDEMVILEAMKMENLLTADGEGVVEKVFVEKGDAVDKGQILIKMH